MHFKNLVENMNSAKQVNAKGSETKHISAVKSFPAPTLSLLRITEPCGVALCTSQVLTDVLAFHEFTTL